MRGSSRARAQGDKRAGRALTRRTLVKRAAVTVGALAAAGGTATWLSWRRLKDGYLALVYPGLGPEPPGHLDPTTVRALEAAVEALLGLRPPSRYREYFEWHAAEVEGYSALYRDFTDYLEQRARNDHASAFADCSIDQRQEILLAVQSARAHPRIGTHPGRIWRGLTRRHLVRYDTYVVREILNLYARTDAWLAVGYEVFPGTPAGLESYRLPPAGA